MTDKFIFLCKIDYLQLWFVNVTCGYIASETIEEILRINHFSVSVLKTNDILYRIDLNGILKLNLKLDFN